MSLKLSIGNEIVATTKTNANGEFELSGPTKKSYELWIESPGWITYQKTIDGSTGGVARLPAITVNPASGGVFEYPVPPGFVFAPRKDPIWTTVCELINNPAEYSGHIVRVHGAITKQFDVSTLSEAYSSDPSCQGSIWLAWGDPPGKQGELGQEYAYIDSPADLKHPERLKWTPIGKPAITFMSSTADERLLERLMEYLDAYYVPTYPFDWYFFECPPFTCPRFHVTAVFFGRFDYYDKTRRRAVRDLAARRITVRSDGFGPKNEWDSQLVLQSVSDFVPNGTKWNVPHHRP